MPTPDIATALDRLGGKAQPIIDTITSLNDLNRREGCHNPQIIVVGEPSSGKSSALKAISNVPFRDKDGTNTRFATELVFCKSSVRRVCARVLSCDNKAYTPKLVLENLHSLDELPELIEHAKSWMETVSTRVPQDRLRVEVFHPLVPSLTLVDIPGVVTTYAADGSKGENAVVRRLVRTYMGQENSIILATFVANAPDDSRSILRECEKCDPDRTRTMHVITKPDRATFALADWGVPLSDRRWGFTYQVYREWKYMHVLGNRPVRKSPTHSNLGEGCFPSNASYDSLPPENRGIKSLREKLSNMLLSNTQARLPKLISGIEADLGERRRKLDQLDTSRATIEWKRAYLLGKAVDFQRLARDAIDGVYDDKFFEGPGDTDCKLRAQIRDHSDAFSIVLDTYGASLKIFAGDGDIGGETTTSGGEYGPDIDDLPHLAPFVDRYSFPDPKLVPMSLLIDDLRAHAASNPTELFNAQNKFLSTHLFRKQVTPWVYIGKRYVSLVTDAARAFIDKLVDHIFEGDKHTSEVFRDSNVAPFFERKRKFLNEKVEELHWPYAEGYARPPGRKVMVRRREWHMAPPGGDLVRTAGLGTIEGYSRTQKLHSNTTMSGLSLKKRSEESGDWAAQTIDLMEAYYGIFLDAFTENVITLAVEGCLIRELEHIFTPEMARRMSDDDLEKLPTEAQYRLAQRSRLEKEIEKLVALLEMCRKHMPRATSPKPTSTPIRTYSAATTTPQAKLPGLTAGASPLKVEMEEAEASGLLSGLSLTDKTREAKAGSCLATPQPTDQTKNPKPTAGFFATSGLAEKSNTARTIKTVDAPGSTDQTKEAEPTSLFATPMSADKANKTGPSSAIIPTPANRTQDTNNGAFWSNAGPRKFTLSFPKQPKPATVTCSPEPKLDHSRPEEIALEQKKIQNKKNGVVEWRPLSQADFEHRGPRSLHWPEAEPTEFLRTHEKNEGRNFDGNQGSTVCYDHISASAIPKDYRCYSPEELRWMHYKGEAPALHEKWPW